MVRLSERDCECIYRQRECVECKHRFVTTEAESKDVIRLYDLANEKQRNRRAKKRGSG